MDRTQFTFYASFYDALADSPDEVKGRIFSAICEYALRGIEPNLTGIEKSIFILIKPNLDASRKKAEAGMRGKPGTSSKDNEKINERCVKDVENKKEKESEYENEIEVENDSYCLPCIDGFFAVTATDVSHYRDIYPGIDIELQLKHMRGWLEADRRRMKTARGMPRFIANWLSKEKPHEETTIEMLDRIIREESNGQRADCNDYALLGFSVPKLEG